LQHNPPHGHNEPRRFRRRGFIVLLGLAGILAGLTLVAPHLGDDRSARASNSPPPTQPETWNDWAPGWEQRMGEQALGRVDFPWEPLGFTVKFLPAQDGLKAGTYPDIKRIEVYVRRGLKISELAFDVAHEIGHAYDWVRMDDAKRAEYKRLRGIQSGDWFTCAGCDDLATPAGDFAETFAYLTVGQINFRSELAPAPDRSQMARLEALIRA
jgi:hypothetical protein